VTDLVPILQRIPFLREVREKDLKRLAKDLRERTVEDGQDVVTQGSEGVAFFLVLEGEAVVAVDGVERRTLGPGDHLGEIALVLGDVPRTATVTARGPVRLASLTPWAFRSFAMDHPDVLWSLAETLARRLLEAPPVPAR
jgi:CRP-like cAMP-binding protein